MTDRLTGFLRDGQDALERDDGAAAVTAFTSALASVPPESGMTVALAMALANAHRLQGDVLQARGVLAGATAALPRASIEEAHALGAALIDAGAPLEASACFARVLSARPSDPAALGAMAAARRLLADPGQAWTLIQRALAIDAKHPALLFTAAQIRHDLGDLRGATRWLDAADAARPNHAPTRMQRAYTSLIAGASTEGWAAFESRALPVPVTRARAWQGEALAGQSILVTAEQGVGDQFQFVRFVPLLETRDAARVVVECHADAVGLFAANGLDAVPRGSATETDWHVPMMSLPHRLGLGDAVHGTRVPYLAAPSPADEASLPPRTSDARPRVGLVWSGNPAFPGRFMRDLSDAMLPTLVGFDGVQWISLQQGTKPDPDEATTNGLASLHSLAPQRDWSATAAMLASLDALVTTDTGIAHLAGAMGIRTWVLLQAVPDWRWGLSGGTTPWYPTLRLIRQKRAGDWKGVIAALHAELAGAFVRG
ncbi:MAG: hypothetical protein V4617_18335 [Gemmatimonadota bacterium]